MALKHQVGMRIRDLRRAAGLTQDELAERADRSTQTIAKIERGEIGASIETIDAISKAVGSPPAMMFPSTRTGKKPTARDKTLSAIVAYASQLKSDDAETLKVIAEALLERSKS